MHFQAAGLKCGGPGDTQSAAGRVSHWNTPSGAGRLCSLGGERHDCITVHCWVSEEHPRSRSPHKAEGTWR